MLKFLMNMYIQVKLTKIYTLEYTYPQESDFSSFLLNNCNFQAKEFFKWMTEDENTSEILLQNCQSDSWISIG